MTPMFKSPSEAIGTTLKLHVRMFEYNADADKYPGFKYEPTVKETKAVDVVLDAASVTRSLVPSDGGRYYVSMFEMPRLLQQQHGLYGQMGISVA